MNKSEMLIEGEILVSRFCRENGLPPVRLEVVSSTKWQFPKTCAYYRNHTTFLCVERCSALGVAGMAWSCPGYVVDKTPIGVQCHELGHHHDWLNGQYQKAFWSEHSHGVWSKSGEGAITSYAPNPAEWYAEMFRLFVTNPDLLKLIRPVTYGIMTEKLTPVETRSWREVMLGYGAPQRSIEAAQNKIAQAERKKAK